jgi:excisionase family DNA binding protein
LRDKREGGPIYTVEEVSDLLGIPRPTLYRYLREYSIPHLRRSGKISIPEESFERIREARDLHKEGLGTGSVRRALREGGGPNARELKERLDWLSENLERLRSKERPATDEGLPSHAIRTILARQNLLVSAMFKLTEMVEELLIANGKPRKAVFDDVESEIQEVAHERSLRRQLEPPKGVPAVTEATGGASYPDRINPSFTPVRGARFGSLARRRRRGIMGVLFALMVLLFLTWALPSMGSELASGIPFFDARKKEESFRGSPDGAAPRGEKATQNRPAGSETPVAGSSGSGEVGKVDEMPDVSNRGVVGAVRVLSRAGFEVAYIKTVASRRRAGAVTGTEPAAGSAVEPETPIVVVMSGGPTGLPPGFRGGGSGSAVESQYAE